MTRKHPDWKELEHGMVPQVQAPAKLSMMELWSKGLPEDLQNCITEKKGFMCKVKARLGFAFNFVVALLGKLVDFLFNVVVGAPRPNLECVGAVDAMLSVLFCI